MAIPGFQTLMRPALAYLADGETTRARNVTVALADVFELSPEERQMVIPSGKTTVIHNRVQWALTYMFQAGLTERPQRGSVRITDLGRQALAKNPDRIDAGVLDQYPSFVAFKGRTRSRRPTAVAPDPQQDLTPQDLLEQAVSKNRQHLESELLQRALTLDPTGFEDLVLRLLEAMGYGRQGSIERTVASGDAGIDGIISQDPLGLDRIYMQAKRYATDQTVTRPLIHEFAGALLAKRGDRGVYITTGSFSRGAIAEVDRLNARIVIIGGPAMARLMVDYEVGVQAESAAALHRIDEDFFDAL